MLPGPASRPAPGTSRARRPRPRRGHRFDDTVEIVPPAGAAALRLVCSGTCRTPPSTGGALNLDNSGSTGAGAVLYSNRGADALGRLLVVNQANPANPQHAVRIQNAGTAHTVSIFHDPAGGAGDPTAEAVDIVSTNEQDTTLGVRGRETGKGTVKITHGKPPARTRTPPPCRSRSRAPVPPARASSSATTRATRPRATCCTSATAGPGTDRLRLTAAGRLELAVQGSEGGIVDRRRRERVPRRPGAARDGRRAAARPRPARTSAASALVRGARSPSTSDDHAEPRRRAAGSDRSRRRSPRTGPSTRPRCRCSTRAASSRRRRRPTCRPSRSTRASRP